MRRLILLLGVCAFTWASPLPLVVQRLPANVSGLTSLAVPVAGVLFAWGLLRERPSLAEWIGIALIAAALLALNFSTSTGGSARSDERTGTQEGVR